MTWKIEVLTTEPRPPHALLADFLAAQWAWKHLTKAQRAAVGHGHRHGLVDGAVRTMAALEERGFMHPDCRLTEAGKAVAKWCVKP